MRDLPERLTAFAELVADPHRRAHAMHHEMVQACAHASARLSNDLDRLELGASLPSLIAGLTDLAPLVPARALWQMARDLRARPDAHRYWQSASVEEIAADLQNAHPTHGNGLRALRALVIRLQHLSSRRHDLTAPRLEEDPRPLIGDLRAQLASAEGESPREICQRQLTRHLEARAAILRQTPFYRRARLSGQIDPLRRLLWWREELLDLAGQMDHQVRRLGRELNPLLIDSGVLRGPDDLLFLSSDRIASIAERRGNGRSARAEVIRNRRRARDLLSTLIQPDAVPLGAIAQRDHLLGVASSPGAVEGRALVVEHLAEDHAPQNGDILVIPRIDPGWSPHLHGVRAVVTEVGGILSHAAMLAREWGVPAVVSVPGITKWLRHGQAITVDGSRGSVWSHACLGRVVRATSHPI